MRNRITFLLLGDLHGNIPKIFSKQFDIIISPGDICGDRSDIVDHYDDFEEYALEKGKKILSFLSTFNKPIIVVPGNWDQTPYRDGLAPYTTNHPFSKLLKSFPLVHNVEYTSFKQLGFTFIGYGSTSAPEPIIITSKNKVEVIEEELQRSIFFKKQFEKLNVLFEKNKNENIIFISHNSPYGTSLDLINNPLSYADGEHYGSIIAKTLISTHNPILACSGHIHEGVGVEVIGKTHCVNSGYKGHINVLIHFNKKTLELEEIEFIGENGI
jgi:Icc-related predicted phosphoesterase